MSLTSPASRRLTGLKRASGRVPLRLKLITAVLALVAIALAVISVAGIWLLRGYLLAPVDAQFPGATRVSDYIVGYLNSGQTQAGYDLSMSWLPASGHPRQVVRPVQSALSSRAPAFRNPPATSIPGPAVPMNATWLNQHTQQPVTVAARSGGGQWRVLAYNLQIPTFSTGTFTGGTVRGIAVVGLNVTSQYQTLARLRDVDLVISAVVLVGLAVLGVAIVRTSLRPLTDIERTAQRIASGELSQRVPDSDPRTEIGRLGRSLNAMLSQIETAFHARVASETAARRSEERMRQFVADASHELRTPLTAIRGYAEYYRQRGGLSGVTGGGAPPGRGPAAGANGTGGPEDGTREARAAPGANASPAGTGAWQTATAAGAGTGAAGNVLPAAGTDTAGGGSPAVGGGVAAGAEGLGQADMDRIMQRVEQESARMGMLVEDMLLLARLDQQRPVARRPVDLLMLAADAVQDARIMAPGRRIGLTVGSGGAFLVLGDEARLRQVIGNLMSNALSHTPDGTPVEVRIGSGVLDHAATDAWSAAPGPAAAPGQPAPGQPAPGAPGRPAAGQPPSAPGQPPSAPGQPAPGQPPSAPGQPPPAEPPGPAVVLEVADSGPGLSPEQASHVFERFYRADQARTRTRGGSGLGLAIVAALTAAHGGAASVESTPGHGATFRITIPLAPEAREV